MISLAPGPFSVHLSGKSPGGCRTRVLGKSRAVTIECENFQRFFYCSKWIRSEEVLALVAFGVHLSGKSPGGCSTRLPGKKRTDP